MKLICTHSEIITFNGILYRRVKWLGLCQECWVKAKLCIHCFPGKGDGKHLSTRHIFL